MKLYHFCAAHMVQQILAEGLTLGMYPLIAETSINFLAPCQWLTTEPDAAKQSWATSSTIPYSRTAYRLTIHVPESYRKMLLQAASLEGKLAGQYLPIVAGWEGSDSWYIYLGKIPPEWIVGCQRTKGWVKAGV